MTDREQLVALALAVLDDNTMGALDLANEVIVEEDRRAQGLSEIPDYADRMTLAEFQEHVSSGMFADCDGHGYLATKTHESEIRVQPSTLNMVRTLHPGFTHVTWYNK